MAGLVNQERGFTKKTVRNLLFLVLLLSTPGSAYAMMDHGGMGHNMPSGTHCALENQNNNPAYDGTITSFNEPAHPTFTVSTLARLASEKCKHKGSGMICHKGKNSTTRTGMGGCCLKKCSPFSKYPEHGGLTSSVPLTVIESSNSPLAERTTGDFLNAPQLFKTRFDSPPSRPPAI
ncbi:hypothetical protein MNBD_NITROSPINAE01-1953 [hydrothermal vent metagenome]|uniref:Uncharacterized protein n=1 Tax=hydrothermal vent metagenome TaxID=652676 RepID=A0A3B1CF04_9ZZZZ